MRETVKEWKDEWIETNGETDDLEVVIDSLDVCNNYIYEGSFVRIPKELDDKKVVHSGQILASSIGARVGAYSLTI